MGVLGELIWRGATETRCAANSLEPLRCCLERSSISLQVRSLFSSQV